MRRRPHESRAEFEERFEAAVLSLQSTVDVVVIKVAEMLPAHVDRDDLRSAAWIGALGSVRRWRESQGLLSTFARHRIRGAVLDYLRSLDHLGRDDRKRWRKIEAELFARIESGDCPGVAFGRCTYTVKPENFSIDEPLNKHDGFIPELLTNDVRAQEDWDRSVEHVLEMCRAVSLNSRHTRVIVAYYIEEMTMRDIGIELGVGEGRISQIHSFAIDKLRERYGRRVAAAGA